MIDEVFGSNANLGTRRAGVARNPPASCEGLGIGARSMRPSIWQQRHELRLVAART